MVIKISMRIRIKKFTVLIKQQKIWSRKWSKRWHMEKDAGYSFLFKFSAFMVTGYSISLKIMFTKKETRSILFYFLFQVYGVLDVQRVAGNFHISVHGLNIYVAQMVSWHFTSILCGIVIPSYIGICQMERLTFTALNFVFLVRNCRSKVMGIYTLLFMGGLVKLYSCLKFRVIIVWYIMKEQSVIFVFTYNNVCKFQTIKCIWLMKLNLRFKQWGNIGIFVNTWTFYRTAWFGHTFLAWKYF